MIFNEDKIIHLRNAVKAKLSEKRYLHTLGVEQMAKHIGAIIMPDRVDELSVAALLHDVAKELAYDEQIALTKASGLDYTEEDLLTKPALHSFAAISVIKGDFSEYATADVLSAVANHTFGNAEMSLFDEIIFISDYAEQGRTYPSCVAVREYLINNLSLENNHKYNVNVLHQASLDATNSTVSSLQERGNLINSRTLKAKSFLEGLVK